MYKVIKAFADLHDAEYPYAVGDTFPRAGIEVSEGRIRELSGSGNKQGCPLIEEVEDEVQEAVAEAAEKAAAEAEEKPKKSKGTKNSKKAKEAEEDGAEEEA